MALGAVLAVSLAVSAYLMALALAEPGRRWLGWITLLPLLLSLRFLLPPMAFVAGGFWGMCVGFFLEFESVAAGEPWLGTYLAQCFVPALYCGLGSYVTRRVGFSPLLLALGWVGVELLLDPLTGQRGLLAGTQGDGIVVRTVGHAAGWTVVAFLLAYVNASLVEIFTAVCAVGAGGSRLFASPSQIRSTCIWDRSICDRPLRFRPERPRAPPFSRFAFPTTT